MRGLDCPISALTVLHLALTVLYLALTVLYLALTVLHAPYSLGGGAAPGRPQCPEAQGLALTVLHVS